MRVEATKLHVEGRVPDGVGAPAYLFARRRGDVMEVVAPAQVEGEKVERKSPEPDTAVSISPVVSAEGSEL